MSGQRTREVWAAEEAAITIYEESGSGYVDDSAYVYCFGQGISVMETDDVEVVGQPGSTSKDIHTTPGTVECQIDEFSYSKASQFTPFSDRSKSYRVFLTCINERYDGITQVNDTYELSGAKKTSRGLTIEESGINKASLTLQAETVT